MFLIFGVDSQGLAFLVTIIVEDFECEHRLSAGYLTISQLRHKCYGFVNSFHVGCRFGLPVFVAATVNGFDDARRPRWNW